MAEFKTPVWIFFDLDDTLWDFHRASAESLRHVFGLFPFLGCGYGGDFDLFAESYHRENDRLWKLHSEGKVTSEFLRTERWRRSVDESGFSLKLIQDCRRADKEYLGFLSSRPYVVDGMGELLDNLTHRVLICVISNGFVDTQYRKLHASGLWRWITRTIISDEIGVQKPSRLIFDYALRETGCRDIPFSENPPVFVGDNFSTDVVGALRAGWRVIWFNSRAMEMPATEEGAFVESSPRFLGVATSAKELSDLLDRIIPQL